MKQEYDLSNGVRRRSHNPDGESDLPIYLEPEIDAFVDKSSAEKNIDRIKIVNRVLKKERFDAAFMAT